MDSNTFYDLLQKDAPEIDVFGERYDINGGLDPNHIYGKESMLVMNPKNMINF